MFHQQPRNVHLIPNRFFSNPAARYFDKTQLLCPKYSPAVSHRVLKLLLLENNPFSNTSSSLHSFAVLLEPARSALKVKTSWVSLGFPFQPITLSCTWIYITLAMLKTEAWLPLSWSASRDVQDAGLEDALGRCWTVAVWRVICKEQNWDTAKREKPTQQLILFYFLIKIFNLLHGSILAIGYSVHRITYQIF